MESNGLAGGAAPILVVDDDPDARAMLAAVLCEDGYSVLEAADGVVALALAERCRPSLILLDMRMPVMDGWQFTQAYRRLPGPHAPLVVMTAAQNPVAWAADVEGIACLAKPLKIDELRLLVRYLLRAASGAHGVEGADADATAEASPLMGELALLLLERQEIVNRLTASKHEPKALADRLERNQTRTGALLSQIGALIRPEGSPIR